MRAGLPPLKPGEIVVDILYRNFGTVLLFRPVTDRVRAWLATSYKFDPSSILGEGRYGCDPATGRAVLQQAINAGYLVSIEWAPTLETPEVKA